jgi:hypothetical protein
VRGGRELSGVAVALTLVLGGSAVGGAAAAQAAAASSRAKQCPVKEIKKVWYGGTSTKCPNLPDELDHLFYPGSPYTTKLKNTYRERTVFIQLRLHDLHYGPLAIDGKFGEQTADTVKRYQRNHHLTVNGKVGLKTWKKLFGLGAA